MIAYLIGMLVLGILSALLSYYGKNYYVRVFDDILGREDDEKLSARVGRGFLYGFFFPAYFFLLGLGLIALLMFLIVAGIIAAIIFVIVWITEKILPHGWFGDILEACFSKIGLSSPLGAKQMPTDAVSMEPIVLDEKVPPKGNDDPKPPSDAGINVTRRHTLD
jgi:hypothetical protein